MILLSRIALLDSSIISNYRYIHASTIDLKGRWNFYNKHKKVTDPKRADPDYFENKASQLSLDKHYLDQLTLLWEEKIGSEREVMMKGSDKLIKHDGSYGLPKLDTSKPRLEFEDVDILKDAPESVKKIFSIEFGERKDLTNSWKKELIDSVNKHKYDSDSLQAKIAWSTAMIRHLTMLVEQMMAKNPKKPTWLTHKIFLLLGYRRKLLRKLREQDTAEFERVLDTLKIGYNIPKQPEHVKTRKAWSEHQLRQRVEAEKERRLEELHEKLKESRDEKVAMIDKDIQNLNAELADIKRRLEEISIIEGTSVANVVGTYQPKLVEELYEYSIHDRLFQLPKVAKSNSA